MPYYTDSWTALDTETTGLTPVGDRIVTAALAHSGGQHREWLINPGVPIGRDAGAVHGLTDDAVRCGLRPAVALRTLRGILGRLAVEAVPLVVMCAPFDLTLLAHELHRHRLLSAPVLPKGLLPPVLDPCELDRLADPARRGRRRLIDLCEWYGVALDRPHNARADAQAAGEVAAAILRTYPALATRPLAELHQMQAAAHTARTGHRWPAHTAGAALYHRNVLA